MNTPILIETTVRGVPVDVVLPAEDSVGTANRIIHELHTAGRHVAGLMKAPMANNYSGNVQKWNNHQEQVHTYVPKHLNEQELALLVLRRKLTNPVTTY